MFFSQWFALSLGKQGKVEVVRWRILWLFFIVPIYISRVVTELQG